MSISSTAASMTRSFSGRCARPSRNEGVWKGRLINKKKDGTVYYEDCTYSPVKDASGNIVNYVSIKHDVTEKLRLEAIAETVDAMNNIGYVFSGIRHEIGNPVSSLSDHHEPAQERNTKRAPRRRSGNIWTRP